MTIGMGIGKKEWSLSSLRGFSFLAAILMVFCSMGGYAEGTGLITIAVEPGQNWTSTMWMGIIPVKKTPQFAAWIETPDGGFVKTISVTARAGRNEWRAAAGETRPEALPVWTGASAGKRVDVASSATPKGGSSVSASDEGLVPGQEYIARFEVNTSFDYNDTWTKGEKPGEKGYSGVNGQPSIVYEARFVAGQPVVIELKPSGKGSVDGADGKLVPGIDGLTTALSIAGRVTIELKQEL